MAWPFLEHFGGGFLGLPALQFSARAGVEPAQSTTKDLEDGDAEEGGSSEGQSSSPEGEEGSSFEEEDESYDEDGQEDDQSAEMSHQTSPTVLSGGGDVHSSGGGDEEHGGERGVGLHDAVAAAGRPPVRHYRPRVRSEDASALPLSVGARFRLLRQELWGVEDMGKRWKNTRASKRREWREKYDEAFKMMQGVRERRQNWLCSTEVINGLCVPLICVALFMLHILMASFFFPKRNEH